MASPRVWPLMWGTPHASHSMVRPDLGVSTRSTCAGAIVASLKKSVRLASVMSVGSVAAELYMSS